MLFTHEQIWDGMTVQSFKDRFVCQAFRMMSRLGCAVERLLRLPHRRLPILLFVILSHPERADEIKQISRCMQPKFVVDFLAQYGDNLSGDDAIAHHIYASKLTR